MNSSSGVLAASRTGAAGDGRDPVAPEHPALDDAAEIFSLLGDPARLRLLVALSGADLCVHDLARIAGHSASATSHALKLLRAHRVVAARREGRHVIYSLDDPHVRELIEVALAHAGHVELAHPERRGRGGGDV